MNVFTNYNFTNSSNINKFITNTVEELKGSTQEVPRDHLRRNDGFENGQYKDHERMQQGFEISEIKQEPSFHFDELASSTCVSFSSPNESSYVAKQFCLSKDLHCKENYPFIWKYEMESTHNDKLTQDNKSTLEDIQSPKAIQEGNTHRLLNMFEDSYSKFKDSKNKINTTQMKESTPNDTKEDARKMNVKKIEGDEAFQLGRQKGIREILASMVSPISSNLSSTLESPDLSLSYLQKENMMLLNKLAGNSGSITRPNFEEEASGISESVTTPNFRETTNVYAANISKEESKVFNSSCKESKFKHPDYKLELEELIRIWLKPFWNTDVISKDEYKDIMIKCVRKISCWKDEERTPVSIRRLVEFYIKKLRNETRKSIRSTCKKTKSTRSSVINEKGGSRSSEAQNLTNDITTRSHNSHNDCSGKAPNIEITIKQSCCNNIKQSCCKKSGKKSSQKIVVSGEKGKSVRRWRY